MKKINGYKLTIDNALLILISCVFSLLLVYIFFDILQSGGHPLYNERSILWIFLSSVVITFMLAHRSVTIKIVSILLIAFYIQRVIITYFFVDQFHYTNYLSFSTELIEAVSELFFYCVLSIVLGKYLLKPFFLVVINKFFSRKLPDYVNIRYFFFKVNFSRLSRFVAYFCIVTITLKICLLLIYSIYTGVEYGANDVLIVWAMNFANGLTIFIIFAIIFFSSNKKENKIFKIALSFILLSAILVTSKGVFLQLALFVYICLCVLKKPVLPKTIISALLIVLITLFVLYPVFAALRNALIAEVFFFDFNQFYGALQNAFFALSNRLGGFDWLTLWMSVPRSEIPPNATLLADIIRTINMLAPGKIISQPDAIPLGKLQLVFGRGHDSSSVYTLGGHSETLAGIATAYTYFGILLAPLFFLIWSGILTAMESSRIHPFHKVSILGSYLVTFISGGGFILMHGGFYWFIFSATFLAGVIWVVNKFKTTFVP